MDNKAGYAIMTMDEIVTAGGAYTGGQHSRVSMGTHQVRRHEGKGLTSTTDSKVCLCYFTCSWIITRGKGLLTTEGEDIKSEEIL